MGYGTLTSMSEYWPEIYYEIYEPHRGKGYATKFTKFVMDAFFNILETTEAQITVPECTLSKDELEIYRKNNTFPKARIQALVMDDGSNEIKASLRVLEKSGFESVHTNQGLKYWINKGGALQ